jgi:hypothetical protein
MRSKTTDLRNMDIVESTYTTLRTIGKDEAWLHNWMKEKPSRLGLGELTIVHSEVSYYKDSGGRLDILAYRADLDTYYEIEVMLGECDADHGFRTLDYWARERLRHPNARHFAVLVAEDLSGRYKTVIETLPQYLPFIGIEIKVLKLALPSGDIATIDTSIVVQPDDLIIDAGDEPTVATKLGNTPKDRAWWEAKENRQFIATVDAIIQYCTQQVGPSRIDYSAQSYISLKKGRRCWLPMWPRSNGVYVYLPSGPDGAVDAPSDFYQQVQAKLAAIGLESPSWTYKYNGGANPIGFAIPYEKVAHSVIRDILTAAYELA